MSAVIAFGFETVRGRAHAMAAGGGWAQRDMPARLVGG